MGFDSAAVQSTNHKNCVGWYLTPVVWLEGLKSSWAVWKAWLSIWRRARAHKLSARSLPCISADLFSSVQRRVTVFYFFHILLERRLLFSLLEKSTKGKLWRFLCLCGILWFFLSSTLAKQGLLFGAYKMLWVEQIISLGRDLITTNCKFKRKKFPGRGHSINLQVIFPHSPLCITQTELCPALLM